MRSEIVVSVNGISLAAAIQSKDDVPAGVRPGVVVLHGFGGTRNGATQEQEAAMYEDAGFVVLRYDMRGCGGSGGYRGRLICDEMVSDAAAAVDWLSDQDAVDPDAVFISGQSFGGAIAIATAAACPTVSGVVSIGGWGDGAAKFRRQHASDEEWRDFNEVLEMGQRWTFDAPAMVSRWRIVPVPVSQRANLPEGSLMEFTADTISSMYDFRPIDVIGRIAPKPVLLVHGAFDDVTPVDESIGLFRAAGKGRDLILLSEIGHFPIGAAPSRVKSIIRDWLLAQTPRSAG